MVRFQKMFPSKCPNCGNEISKQSLDEIVTKILKSIELNLNEDRIKYHTFIIYSPIVRSQKG